MDNLSKTLQSAGWSWWRRIMLNSQPCPALQPNFEGWELWSDLSHWMAGGCEGERERERDFATPEIRVTSGLYNKNEGQTGIFRAHGRNIELLAWQVLLDVSGGSWWGWGRCSLARDRRAGWLAVIIHWLGRSVSSYQAIKLSPIMSAAKLLLQASHYNCMKTLPV